jgi:hypothetical protein
MRLRGRRPFPDDGRRAKINTRLTIMKTPRPLESIVDLSAPAQFSFLFIVMEFLGAFRAEERGFVRLDSADGTLRNKFHIRDVRGVMRITTCACARIKLEVDVSSCDDSRRLFIRSWIDKALQ